MASFDVMSLFIRMSIKETMCLLSRYFEEDILRLFRNILTVAYISLAGLFYEEIEGWPCVHHYLQ
jgi:hypothetical protein